MISKDILKQILVSNHEDIEKYSIIPRSLPSDDFPCRIFVGLRRAGKTFMLYQKILQLLSSGRDWSDMLYLNFEDDRLDNFEMTDFDLILQAHSEIYGKRPMLFLDEIQNVDGWEKFARRLADSKYKVWITGSNAKMLSSEIMSALGGRYIPEEVYPYSFREFLDVQGVKYDEPSLLALDSRSEVVRWWNEYLKWGGLPEAASLSVKRDYISSVFQKIYLGDIVGRNKVSASVTLRLLFKKLSENLGRPVSYNRLSHSLSSINGKISMPTVCRYIEYSEVAWLLLRLRNVSAPFAEKESICKYYFIDNGILNLFMLGGETMLLENVVALALFRKYGHDSENERVFFYNDKVEVDFYVLEDALAIQVSYSISQSVTTYEREVNALKRLPNVLECRKRLILTNDESGTLEDEFGTIDIIPVWEWLLS